MAVNMAVNIAAIIELFVISLDNGTEKKVLFRCLDGLQCLWMAKPSIHFCSNLIL